jgi:hypothetical protein
MITHAERAHVGESAASEGSTIYQGDRLSTESGGLMRISSSGLALQLEAQSTLVLRHPANPEARTTAELASGTLVFSAARTGNIIVMADDALIRPATKGPAIAHIRVVSRRELRIYAQRGALDFSYHGESATIPEGAAYRVLLDPSEAEARVSTEPDQDKKSPTRKPHLGKFVFIAVGVALGIGIPLLMHALESPDRPGP